MVVTGAKHKHWNEMVGLLLFAIGLLITLSLVSYNAVDPCFSVSGTGAGVRNTIGIIGAYLSDALLHLFGLSAYVIPLLMFGYALFFTLGREAVHPLLKKIGGVIFFISAGAFFGLRERNDHGCSGSPYRQAACSAASLRACLFPDFPASAPTSSRSRPCSSRSCCSPPFLRSRHWRGCAHLNGRMMEQLDILITVYRGRREKAREAKKRPAAPKEPPKIVDTRKTDLRASGPAHRKTGKTAEARAGQLRVHGQGKGGQGRLPAPVTGPARSRPAGRKEGLERGHVAQSELLQHKLQDFDIQGRITQVYPGPVVTMFEFEPAPGVKVSRIVNLVGRPGACHEGRERAHRGAAAGQGGGRHRGAEQHARDGLLPPDPRDARSTSRTNRSSRSPWARTSSARR